MAAEFALVMAGAAAAHQAAAASRQGNGQQRADRTRRTTADPQRAQQGATAAAAAAAAAPAALDSLSRLQQLADASPQVAQLRRLQVLADGRFAPVAQLAGGPEEEELVQGKFASAELQPQLQQAPRANNTGLPDQLKSGIESLSGLSMDHVRVHYNSAQPAQLNALAYAQGSDIHIAPGQEQHLPHEAWHVVQQAQGRVAPTAQMKEGMPVNDDAGLEAEADAMGGLAIQMVGDGNRSLPPIIPNSRMAAQRRQLAICQLKPQQVVTTGTTHLVGIRNGSLFAGDEIDGDVVSGTQFTIDIDDPIWSRRGPNQEVPGNWRQDREAAQNYAWYPKYSDNQSNYVKDGWHHLRDETFVKIGDSASTPAPREGETPDRRARAAPAGAPQNFDPSDVRKFVRSQQDYQNYLFSNYSMQSVMSSHRSVGFEYEFAHHSLDVESHISLALSEPFSRLFPVRFELETDSGSVVEIGMPPFVIPNAEDGGPDKEKLAAVHQTMKKTMEAVRDNSYKQDTTIPELLPQLADLNLGINWQLQKSVQEGGKCHGMHLKKDESGKLKGSVYSQMNISLTGDESSHLIQTMQEHFSKDPNFAEQGILGDAYRALEQLAEKNSVPKQAVVHLHKAFANMLAIPSIMLRNSGELTEALPELLDLSSVVKELFSVWVKDTVPNVLATTSTDPALLANYAPLAANLVADEFLPLVLEKIERLTFWSENDGKMQKLQDIKTQFTFERSSSYRQLQHDLQDMPEDSAALLPLAKIICNMMDPNDDNGEFTLQEKQDTSGGGAQKRFDQRDEAFKDELARRLQLAGTRKMSRIQQLHDTVKNEMSTLLRLMADPGVVRAERTKCHEEVFGDGKGVRKDTYVSQPPGAKAGLRHSVTEIRSDAAMKVFFES
jgi:hypothetical protein